MANGAPPPGAWSSGLFDCFDDVSGCCLTLFCPCVTFGRIAAILDRGGGGTCCVSGTLYLLLSAWTGGQPSVLTGGLGCLYSCCYRSKLRAQYGLAEGPCRCPDCCVHLWCEPCALCQEYRELKARGFDMSKGWEENMERMGKAGGAAATAPHESRDVALAQRSACVRANVADAAGPSACSVKLPSDLLLLFCTSIFAACLFRPVCSVV